MSNTMVIGLMKERRRAQAAKRPIGGYIGALMLVAILVGGAAAAMWMSPNLITPDTLVAPNAAHPFGTDSSGRDILARTLAAALSDLPLALLSTVLAAIVGTILGLLATFSARSDGIMRIVDGFQAFPTLILILVIVQVTGGGIPILALTLSL